MVSDQVQIGSIGGGGRYDDLTGVFGLKGVSGVGISFGFARIYDVMEELGLFPADIAQALEVLIVAFDGEDHGYAFELLSELRRAGVKADLYPSPAKMKKQMKYANDVGAPKVIVIGSEERESGQLTVKDMESGEQSKVSRAEIVEKLMK